MKVLFIGGTGVISSACSELALSVGIDLYLLTRGQSSRKTPEGAYIITADIRDVASARSAVEGHHFDAVVDWISFTPDQIQNNISLFRDRTSQYIFISSASVYATPKSYPVTEFHKVENPYWKYAQDKIACEVLLEKTHKESGFPVTIVRPSHTYDQTMLPITGRYTVVNRMLQGKKVIVHGDGTSLWTLTHHQDFARGFVPLLGHQDTIGETYHITSDEWLSWNQIFNMIADAFDTRADILHIPSDFINQHDQEWGAGLLGDKSISMIFDNTKIKSVAPDFKATIPFSEGVCQIASWFDADAARKVLDAKKDKIMDEIILSYEKSKA